MTPQQIQLVRQTWRLLRDVDPTLLGDVFYGYLFLKHPALRRLFTGSMDVQYRKFMDMLSLIVARIDQPAEVAAELGPLAQRHRDYGVKPEHYAVVGDALLWALERGLGNDWTDDVRDAWLACYTTLTKLMLNAG